MYYIYIHTFKTTGKSYIGYTSKTVSERLERHIKNAFTYNHQTHFYKALRKYGVKDIKTQVIYKTTVKSVALKKEVELIEKYNTINEGYNTARGGTGGKTIDKIKEPEKYKQWYNKKLLKVQGPNNPRYSGFTDEELVRYACDYIIKNGKLTTVDWQLYCKEHKLPMSFAKMRFNGLKWPGFRQLIKNQLIIDGYDLTNKSDKELFFYTRTQEHNNNLGKGWKGSVWYNNGISNKRFRVTDNIPPGYIKGRRLHNK